MMVLNNYKIFQIIYESETYSIFRAIRLKDNQPVIIKTHINDIASAKQYNDFLCELEMGQALAHPNIIKYYDLEESEHHLVLVMEDFDGIELTKLIPQHGFSLANFLIMALQLAKAIGAIHQQYIMHQMISPDAILAQPSTYNIKVMDFSSAARWIYQKQSPINYETISPNKLLYFSPEQTGRMNRIIDFRTDFYSLGIVFYQMLCGHAPYFASDASELVYCHIAKPPIFPYEKRSEIPQIVFAIIEKLLAKTVEERYQSAYGLEADLQICLDQLKTTGFIKNFEIGAEDILNQFYIHQKLYGREEEILQLLEMFNDVCEGKVDSVFLMVHGYSGIGKTSLINEVQKPLLQTKGKFIVGKCDQRERNIPYAAFIQAFKHFIMQILAGSEETILEWKKRLLNALGPNGQIMTRLIPELEIIIGTQPPVSELSPIENQNRFQYVFCNFIKVLSDASHPLVIFIDDLQWANGSILSLIKLISLHPEIHYVSFIGAYRDNEVNANHPLSLMIDEIQKQKPIKDIALKPLTFQQINQLVADSIHASPSVVEPLVELIYKKTQGNPFFTIQFLTLLYQSNLICFDSIQRKWQWKLHEIETIDVTDNVVDLMINKIHQLSTDTQRILSLAANIGYLFDLKMLSIISELTVEDTSKFIWSAIQAGLILPIGKSGAADIFDQQQFQFLHDRVYQAAAMLTPQQQAKSLHLKIGHLLLEKTPPDQLEKKLDYIVSQLNAGSELIVDENEKVNLVKLNLTLAKKAKYSTAYISAINHAKFGMALLPENSWEEYYDLTFGLYKQLAECEYLTGEFAEAEKLYPIMLQSVKSNLDKISVYIIKKSQMELQGRYLSAIDVMQEGLALYNITLPRADELLHQNLQEEINKITINLAEKKIKDLINAPEMENLDAKIVMKLLYGMWTPCYTSNLHHLAMLVSALMVNLSLRYGNCEESSAAYTSYSVYAGEFTGDYTKAYEFGKLGIKLSHKYFNLSLRCMAYLMFGGGTCFWTKSLKKSFHYLDRCYELGIESGNLVGSGHAINFKLFYRYSQGIELTTLHKLLQNFLSFLKRINIAMYDLTLALTQPIYYLVGHNEYLNDDEYLTTYKDMPVFKTSYFVGKVIVAYLLNKDIKEQLVYADIALKIVPEVLRGVYEIVESQFYAALIYLSAYSKAKSNTDKEQYFNNVKVIKAQMKVWMKNSKANCSHKFLLIKAECARILNKSMEKVTELYEQAIAEACTYAFIQYEALGHELYAKYWLQKNKIEIANIYFQKAYDLYNRWGAQVKSRQLLEEVPKMCSNLKIVSRQTESVAKSNTVELKPLALEAKATIKPAKPSEVNLSVLLVAMLQAIMKNAGAQKGAFVLNNENRLTVEAEYDINSGPSSTLQAIPVAAWENGPHSIIQFVKRTKQYTILGNAYTNPQFKLDPYIVRTNMKSILCMPIFKKEEVRGILYLENNSAVDAFTSHHIEVLNILASQIGISLENALLYESNRLITERLNQALKSANMGTWCWSIDDKLNWDDHMFKLCGIKKEEFGNDYASFMAIVHPDDQEKVQASIRRALEQGVYFDLQLRIIRYDDNSIRTLVSRANPYYDDKGQVKGLIGACCDITHLKVLEEERDLALKAANVGLWNFNIKTNEVSVDQQILALYGIKQENMKYPYDYFLSLIHPDDWARVKQALEVTMTTDVPYEEEFRIIKQDTNTIHTIASRAKVFRNAQGEAERITGVNWDITQKKQLEEERLQALKQAEEKERQRAEEAVKYQRDMENFIDSICHEFRNPLHSIYGYLDILKTAIFAIEDLYEKGGDSYQIKQFLRQINEAAAIILDCANHQQIIADEALDLSKLKTNMVVLNEVPFYPKDIVTSVLSMVKPELEKKQIKVNLCFEDKNILVKNDPIRFKQILFNLINNAIKFTKDGSISIEVHTEKQLQDKIILYVSIADTGIGISEEQQKRIFIPFMQANYTVGQEYKGSGLGLAISKKLIQLMGGDITVESQLGKGSTFHFTIQCTPVSLQDTLHVEKQPTENIAAFISTKGESTPKNILIVEDNKFNQKVLIRILESAGYKYVVANDGVEAVMNYKNGKFDLIFMDIEMPKMNGIEATREIRQYEKEAALPETPVIGLSAHARSEYRLNALDVGMSDYITKPFQKERILKKIKDYCFRSSQMQSHLAGPQGNELAVVQEAEENTTRRKSNIKSDTINAKRQRTVNTAEIAMRSGSPLYSNNNQKLSFNQQEGVASIEEKSQPLAKHFL